MLSDEYIDKLLEPFAQRQEYISNYVLQIIAQRIKEVGDILPSDLYKLQTLMRSGADIRKIQMKLAELAGVQVASINKLIEAVALDVYMDSKIYYDFRKIPFIPFAENTQLQNVVQSVARHTVNSYMNLSKAQAFMLRDSSGNLVSTDLSKTYYTVVDRAVQATQMGTVDYHTAIRQTLVDLTENGMQTVQYVAESGRVHHQRLDTAVRRNILDGIREINSGVQVLVGEQFDADGVEITVHGNSAPDHEPIQGHQFTNIEFEKLQTDKPFKDVNGKHFKAIRRAIGVWNCKHFTFSIVVGAHSPTYTQEELDKFIADNHKGYTDSKGRHYTMYQCTQKQRDYELRIRRARENAVIGNKSGDKVLQNKYTAQAKDLMKQYRAFSKACGLSVKLDRTQVLGYPIK